MGNAATSAPHSHASAQDDVVRVLRDGDDGSLEAKDAQHATDAIGAEELTSIYRAMARARAVDERMVALQRQGVIGFHAAAQGEEAAIVGSAAALRDTDWIFPAHRELAAALYRGLSLQAYVNHMFGNAGDPSRGRQMPDHLGSRSARIASMSGDQGRAGAQITHAAGFAWGARIKREDVVTLVYFDERAPEGGEFHNGANFAGVFKAPLVLFCRNADPSISIAEKGVAYAIPAVRCDGGDLLAVYTVTKEAAQKARSGGGPTLIEALTPRALASSANAKDDKRRDPIARLRRHLDARGLWSDAKQRELDAQLEAELAAALAAAETIGPPAPATLFDDVYASPPRHLEEQRSELARTDLARTGPRAK